MINEVEDVEDGTKTVYLIGWMSPQSGQIVFFATYPEPHPKSVRGFLPLVVTSATYRTQLGYTGAKNILVNFAKAAFPKLIHRLR